MASPYESGVRNIASGRCIDVESIQNLHISESIDAVLVYELFRALVLLLAERDARRMHAIFLRGLDDEPAPATADVEQALALMQLKLSQRVHDFLLLRLLQRVRRVLEIRARVAHRRVEPLREEIVAEIESYQKIIDGARQVVDNYKPTIKTDPAWTMTTLGKVCDFVRGPFGGSLKKEIFVEDGYYESGAKRRNLGEAKKCVELVKEHILHHPERSLGIIAFSESQQQTISDAINTFIIENPGYQDFFDPEKEESFYRASMCDA